MSNLQLNGIEGIYVYAWGEYIMYVLYMHVYLRLVGYTASTPGTSNSYICTVMHTGVSMTCMWHVMHGGGRVK